MTLRILTLTFACLAATASAQGPRMTVRGTETILAIDVAEITIRASGGIAETEMLLTFRNDNNRAVEGEFSLPLPPGATVSNYALEVNGALREAVAVEKERALHAYETIKRQMIDPGIVERQAGNVYRTRVFPVPAKGTKQLRIGYVEALPERSGAFAYQCPLSFHSAPARVTLTVHTADGVVPQWNGTPALTFFREQDTHTCELEKTAIQGTLEITEPLPAEGVLHAETGDAPRFLWCGRFPDVPEMLRPAPARVLLFFDASEASLDQDPAASFALLDAWFATLGDFDVELRFLRDRATPGGVHRVSKGDWTALRQAIESADREGSHSLLGLTDAGADAADLILYCGGGRATAGPRIGEIGKPLIVIQSGTGAPANALVDAARRSGGSIIAVDQADPATAVRQLGREPFRMHSINGRTDIFHILDDDDPAPGDLVRVVGRWPKGPLPAMELAFSSGPEIHTRLALPAVRTDAHHVLRRLHAQRELAALEAAPVPDRAAILAHCRTHNLASDTTSLIVLERFEDHIRFEIPPPEPELRARYEAAIRKDEEGTPRLADVWKRHRDYHFREFPGEEIILLPRMRQIAIWKNAVNILFDAGEIDATAFAAITGWQDRALALAARRKELDSAAAHAAWLEALDEAAAAGSELAATPIQPPPPGKPVVVSVRGLVRNPDVVRADESLTLLDAIQRAGGPLLEPTPRYVALYRNAGKTLYNVRSKEFKDMALLPADMIVLESKYGAHGSYDGFNAVDGFRSIDPFGPSPRNTPRDQPAIVRQQDVWVGHAAGGNDPFAGGRRPVKPLPSVKIHDPSDAEPPDMDDFARELAAGADPHPAYRKLKGRHRYPVRFHIDAARLLARHGHGELASTVLSTIVSRGGGHLPSRLAEAFWLVDFGLVQTAAARLAEPTGAEDSPLLAYARATLAADPALTSPLREAIDSQIDTSFSLIALHDTGHLGTIDADIRIVVQSSDITRQPEINIVDPLGEVVMPHNSISRTGGRITSAPGISEYIIRRALPGTYTLSARSGNEATMRVTIHTDFARPAQKTRHETRHIPAAGSHDSITTIDWQFR